MHAAADRPEFAPPPQPGMLRAMVLAVIAHILLLLGLTQGLQWQREEQNVAAEAELWAAVPQQAAPRAEPVPPPPVVKAPPLPEPPVVKPPVVKPPPEPPVRRDADIAVEREKQKRELEKRKQAEAERERAEAERERAERRKLEAAQKKKQEEAARRKEEQAKQLAEAKRREAEQKRKEEEAREARDAKRLAQLREDNMRRIQGMAGTGSPSSTGSAAQSSGPSASWGARVQARVKPNIVFSEDFSGNPKAEVEVRMAPDGTIVGKRLVRSSGVKAWDDAVLRALDKTEVLPRDIDGRVPPVVVIDFRPKG